MRILVLSLETWRDDTNGGNVLSNIFSEFNAEFAQVYCSSGIPQNKLCKKYFQMTDGMAIQNILHHTPMGKKFYLSESVKNDELSGDVKISKLKKIASCETMRVARQMVWGLSNYKNEQLDRFVLDFNPDIIFAPCYGVTYMLSLTRHIAKIIKKPIISYISDDSYSFRQVRFSPVFWLNRLVIRSAIKKTWGLYQLIYTMTEEQKNYMERLGKPVKILCKSGEFKALKIEKSIHNPIRFIYAGGIYLNRWKTLMLLVSCMRKINSSEIKCVLDIYTGNALNKRALAILNDGVTSRVHGTIPYDQLMEEYHNSDVALHVEGLDIKNRLLVRMSFSTKILDCLDSSCAVMAICDKKQGGFYYLKQEDAAICVSNEDEILKALEEICSNPEILLEYRNKAVECGKRNHYKEKISNGLKEDFKAVLDNENRVDKLL